jgi:hypothetical protein
VPADTWAPAEGSGQKKWVLLSCPGTTGADLTRGRHVNKGRKEADGRGQAVWQLWAAVVLTARSA